MSWRFRALLRLLNMIQATLLPTITPLFRRHTPPPTPATVGTVRPVINGQIVTVAGRLIPAPPAIRTASNRKAINDLLKVDHWLVAQALAEAEARGDDFVTVQFQGANPNRLLRADRDAMNDYLFGETNPCWQC